MYIAITVITILELQILFELLLTSVNVPLTVWIRLVGVDIQQSICCDSGSYYIHFYPFQNLHWTIITITLCKISSVFVLIISKKPSGRIQQTKTKTDRA